MSDIDRDGDVDALDSSGDLHINHPPTSFQTLGDATPGLPGKHQERTKSPAEPRRHDGLHASLFLPPWRLSSPESLTFSAL